MQPSFYTAPTKPEKGTKGNTEKIEKRDRGQAHDEKPRPKTEKPGKPKN
jgi:hypothetical protein